MLAAVFAGCGENRAASPLSPTLLSSGSSDDVRRAGGQFAPRRTYHEGDDHDDPEPGPPPDPGTGPMPNPDPVPPPEGTPPPVQLTITVIGSFGNGAFAPNPLQAAIGNTIVWMNNDLVPHDIVLDDGTPVGNLAPGQSSLPIALAVETAGYHCTVHPTMVGQVTTIPPAAPTDPSQGPPPDPTAPPPPPSDPYGDGDGGGYDDDYY